MIINTFFLRIAASCNLDCDYCYVFKHRDLSWKYMPPTISDDIVISFADRLKEYSLCNNLSKINIIFHGGEPLICGSEKIISFVDTINSILGNEIVVSYSLQTNGTLITEEFLNACKRRNIGISLSIDGPSIVHDKHRKYKNGNGSHSDVLKSIRLLKNYPSIFEGVIGVIDPYFSPEETLDFFDKLDIENVDLLLPDSTYIDLPEGRSEDPELYKRWLIEAFYSWFYNHQSIHLRTFEHILTGILGENGALDSFGLGSLDYLTIETDGSYHTSDILKVAYENASAIGFGVKDKSMMDALTSDKVKQYNHLLSIENLPQKCRDCVYSQICGGGSLPHRYSDKNGFNNPSVYCDEMYSLLTYATDIIQNAVNEEVNYE